VQYRDRRGRHKSNDMGDENWRRSLLSAALATTPETNARLPLQPRAPATTIVPAKTRLVPDVSNPPSSKARLVPDVSNRRFAGGVALTPWSRPWAGTHRSLVFQVYASGRRKRPARSTQRWIPSSRPAPRSPTSVTCLPTVVRGERCRSSLGRAECSGTIDTA
jgi:hypothetical protein